MMRQYELLERVQAYNPEANEALINKAYVYAMQKHGVQKRASGDPYFAHPLEVAAILTDLQLDDASIIVGLLHDTIEDTSATRSEIDEIFGDQIGMLVDGLTKVGRLNLASKKAEQAVNLRKLLLAISKDVRVLLVKLADRLHNMRTLHFVPDHKRGRISEETMDIYAPLAGLLGMQDMREELEDLAFKYLHPEPHAMITAHLEDKAEQQEQVIEKIEQHLREELAINGLDGEITGRLKKPYSVFNKMQRKNIALEQLSDLFGFRVIFPNVEDCYKALGIIHRRWSMVPGRFKDYISTPKKNEYRSIHTTVMGPEKQRVELQIRTRDMHDIAEFGIAAHHLYKEYHVGEETESPQSPAYNWLKNIIDTLAQADNETELLEHTKLELFVDQVFCFTPAGRLIALPSGATPVDFAYAVHTDIGNSYRGVKINGKISPIVTELQNGDEVEIIRGKTPNPQMAWANIAVTGKAKSAIRRACKAVMRDEYREFGKDILLHAFERMGKAYDEAHLIAVLPKFRLEDIDELLTQVGMSTMTSEDVLTAVYPDWKSDREKQNQNIAYSDLDDPQNPKSWFKINHFQGFGDLLSKQEKTNYDGAVAQISFPNVGFPLPVKLSSEGAAPGDRIIGILTDENEIVIYPIHSNQLQKFDDQMERWIDISWNYENLSEARFPARIHIKMLNEPGSLANVTRIVADSDANIENIKRLMRAVDYYEFILDVEIWDLKHLNHILSGLRGLSSVANAERV